MRLLASFVLLAGLAGAADLPYFSVLSEDAGAWPEILGSIGFQRQPAGVARIFVTRAGASASVEWPTRVERGAILILEGESSLADLFGFRRGPADPVRVQSLTDVHRPALRVVPPLARPTQLRRPASHSRRRPGTVCRSPDTSWWGRLSNRAAFHE